MPPEIELSNQLFQNSNYNQDNITQEQAAQEPPIEYINSHREITQKEIDEAPILVLEADKKSNLFKNQIIKINAAGLIGGRDLKDGVSIFGLKSQDDKNNTFKVDYELNYNEQLDIPYAFTIYYKTDSKKYYIRAYTGQGIDNKILFIKLNGNYALPIKQKEILSISDTIFQITPLENQCLEIINLSKKENATTSPSTQIFNPNVTQLVTIGRGNNCNFIFNKDKSFSRVNTSFVYEEDNKEWTINDGTINKKSTNGSWVFATHSFPIVENMECQILSNLVRFTFEKKN